MEVVREISRREVESDGEGNEGANGSAGGLYLEINPAPVERWR